LKGKNGECAACLKYSELIFVGNKIYIKCNIWRVALCPSYIWDAQFLKVKCTLHTTNKGLLAAILFRISLYLLPKDTRFKIYKT
jgi:hypothetical protein